MAKAENLKKNLVFMFATYFRATEVLEMAKAKAKEVLVMLALPGVQVRRRRRAR